MRRFATIAKSSIIPPITRFNDIFDKYDAFFFDAYGVLKNSAGMIPEAESCLLALKARNKPFFGRLKRRFPPSFSSFGNL